MMRDTMLIKGDWRQSCLDALAADGYTVVAPVLDGDITRFRPCRSADQMALDRVNTDYPLKEVFFPMTETLLRYQSHPGGDESFSLPPVEDQRIAVLGCRPCDAAALGVLDLVFNWDYGDVFYNHRRSESLVIAVACEKSDAACFCTSLGLGPEATEGSDLLIHAASEKGATITPHSEKGAVFLQAHADVFTETVGDVSVKVADVPVKFDIERIKPWLDEHFEDDLWEQVAMKCLGCGSCSYLCPTCHCFDVVDEANWQEGERRRNFDCCAFALFTMHASGHNPRPTSAARYRNRVMHKYRYFVERFERTACVGCGRCLRVCGAGQNLVRILRAIASRAEDGVPAEDSA